MVHLSWSYNVFRTEVLTSGLMCLLSNTKAASRAAVEFPTRLNLNVCLCGFRGLRCFPKLFFVNGNKNETVYVYMKLAIRKWYGRTAENKTSFFGPGG